MTMTQTSGSTMESTGAAPQFHWEPQPAAQAFVSELIKDFLARCPGAAGLAEKMKTQTGTRFLDWIDFIETPRTAQAQERLRDTGFSLRPQPGAPDCWVHEGAMFPSILLGSDGVSRIGIKVDWVADFLATWQFSHDPRIVGGPWSQFRKALAFTGAKTELWVVERHGYRGFEPVKNDEAKSLAAMRHFEAIRRRNRDFYPDDAKGFAEVNRILDAAIADIGRDWTCDLFFFAERENWQRKNRAGQVQKGRQDRLGLGWANHDHHTYRCSREFYTQTYAVLEKLGFKARERFYAGAEAGWGAQVIEQPITNIAIFCDVDMSPEELAGDFAHNGLPARKELGTIGLWCALHGEAMLQAGMHHLECQFDWWALKEQLQTDAAIKMMDPFTTFPFLRQAFTEGERWAVKEERLQNLVRDGRISAEQAEQFRRNGALGSHLENLERNDGYKGFNQQGVSHIISKTDPRKQGAVQPALSGA